MLNRINGIALFFLLIACNCDAQIIPATYVIAYNARTIDSARAGNYEILTMNMDGTDKENISRQKSVEWTYYAYKNRLFYVSDKDTCDGCYFL